MSDRSSSERSPGESGERSPAGRPPDVLVAYGSKHGATAEIAERIGAVLRSEGLAVEVLAAHGVKRLEGYRAVVLGSAVYALRWRHDARRLLQRLRGVTPGQGMWLYSSGPLDDESHEPSKVVGKAVRNAAELPGVRDHRIFAGRYPIEPSNFIERSMLKHVPEDRRDFRDWAEIEGWARGIAGELAGAAPPASERLSTP